MDQQATSKEVDGLGLLLIPFPYRTEAGAFKNLGEHDSGAWGWFEVEQGWLPGSEDKAARAAFVTFVLNLVAKAKSKGRVDGVVLPELSLDYALYGQLARALATDTSIDFIISGLSSDRAGRQGNFVAVAPLFLLGSDRADLGVLDDLFLVREKHHRWKLTKSQLDDYDLGSALDPNRHWWERLDILGRSLDVLVYRGETTLTTLICEDLARVDPCQAVLRAIGPNLVIALLMDGPQLPMRWPGRYATVLADDPGSSVLSLSSMALIKRGNDLGRYPRQSSVGLWKDEQTGVRELQLPRDAHAVHLLLKATRMTERALDGRSDDGQAIRWEWESCVGVAGDADMRPSWIAAGVAPRSAGASAA